MVWAQCQGARHIKPISGKLIRMVESQEQVATMGFVDTLAEQAVLESLLDGNKPAYAAGSESLHYLLKTPFRYPPLRWGSRFGKAIEPSLFYGGRSLNVALAESAYYRLVFLYSMEGPKPKRAIRSEHTIFSANYKTDRGVRLQDAPFNEYQSDLSHPSRYNKSQQLGTDMRNEGVVAFEYKSARSSGTCVALFVSSAFVSTKPINMQQWFCETSDEGVTFKSISESEPHFYPDDYFLVEGRLPLPA